MLCVQSVSVLALGVMALTCLSGIHANDAFDTSVRWQQCPVLSGSNSVTPSSDNLYTSAQCTYITAPIVYSGLGPAASNSSLSVFVKRIYKGETVPLKQVWLLAGGPGLGNEGNELLSAAMVSILDTDTAIYLMDYRGTGRSTNMNCPADVNPITSAQQCIDYLQRTYSQALLSSVTTTNCATDLLYSMKLTRAELKSNTTINPSGQTPTSAIMGQSFGTFVGTRALLVAEHYGVSDMITATVLDGYGPPTMLLTTRIDFGQNNIILDLLNRCGADPDCNRRMLRDPQDTSPLQVAYSLREEIRQGVSECANHFNVTVGSFSRALDNLVNDWYQRVLIAPVIRRFKTCSDRDKQDLSALFTQKSAASGSANPFAGYNSVVHVFNIIFNELWEEGIDCGKIDGYSDHSIGAGYVASFYCPIIPLWPVKYSDSLSEMWPSQLTTSKILITNGDLDPATPVYWSHMAFTRLAQTFTSWRGGRAAGNPIPPPGSGQSDAQLGYIIIPDACHTSLACSPMVINGAAPRFPTCSGAIQASFLKLTMSSNASSMSDIDTSCLTLPTMLAIDVTGVRPGVGLKGYRDAARALFGPQAQVWPQDPTPAPSPNPSTTVTPNPSPWSPAGHGTDGNSDCEVEKRKSLILTIVTPVFALLACVAVIGWFVSVQRCRSAHVRNPGVTMADVAGRETAYRHLGS